MLPPVDGSGPVSANVIEIPCAVAFNTVAWPYVHLRGRHGWPADRARDRVVGIVLDGVANNAGKEST